MRERGTVEMILSTDQRTRVWVMVGRFGSETAAESIALHACLR